MKRLVLSAACVLCWASGARAADLLSGTWTAGDGLRAQTYIFKVSGDRISGIVCGPCNDATAVFRIEDGRILGADRASFVIRRAAGRERVEASLARNQLTLSGRPEGNASAAPTSLSLKRVVENFELNAQPLPPTPAAARAGASKASSIEGHWVSVGRTAQQNWILETRTTVACRTAWMRQRQTSGRVPEDTDAVRRHVPPRDPANRERCRLSAGEDGAAMRAAYRRAAGSTNSTRTASGSIANTNRPNAR